MIDNGAIERHAAALMELGARIERFDPDPVPLHEYIQEPAARWVVQQVVSGSCVPQNSATLYALRQALDELRVFQRVRT